MADSLSTIGSIAFHIVSVITPMPAGVSGNMVDIVDINRQHVENFTGNNIGSNSIEDKYQPAILNYAKADTVNAINAQAGGENLKLADLSIAETGEAVSAEQYKQLAEMFLKAIGRKIQFERSVS
jgi:hypothetical protein